MDRIIAVAAILKERLWDPAMCANGGLESRVQCDCQRTSKVPGEMTKRTDDRSIFSPLKVKKETFMAVYSGSD